LGLGKVKTDLTVISYGLISDTGMVSFFTLEPGEKELGRKGGLMEIINP
jgi:hypothetical protein